MIRRFIVAGIMIVWATGAVQDDTSLLFISCDAPFTQEQIVTDPQLLLRVAQETLWHIRSHRDEKQVQAQVIAQHGYTLSDVETTLEFLVKVIKEDLSKKRKHRIADSSFLNKHFSFIKWLGDGKQALKRHITIPKDHIYLTHYLVCTVQGKHQKSKEYAYALYAAPDDERALTKQGGVCTKEKCVRLQYTKQDIVGGVLDTASLAKPLVWLNREGLEMALMQGSVQVCFEDGTHKLFTIDKSNKFPYVHGVHKHNQKRYWYFKESDDKKIAMEKGAVFAGDVTNLGLGKLIAVQYINRTTKKPEIQLGVLVDKGGAFVDNLYQLDLFEGKFAHLDQFRKAIKGVPQYVQAYILVRKDAKKGIA